MVVAAPSYCPCLSRRNQS